MPDDGFQLKHVTLKEIIKCCVWGNSVYVLNYSLTVLTSIFSTELWYSYTIRQWCHGNKTITSTYPHGCVWPQHWEFLQVKPTNMKNITLIF